MSIAQQKSELERQLAARRRLQPIPPAWREAYEQRRLAEFSRLVSLWSPLLVLAYLACGGFTWLSYGDLLHGADLRAFLVSELLSLVLGAWGLWLARRPDSRQRAQRLIPILFGLTLFAKVLAGLVVQDPWLAINQVYITVLVLVIGMLALQLSLRAALFGGLLGLSAFVVAPWVATLEFSLLFLGHFLLTATVCLFVSLLSEDRSRIAFLQGCLLDLERREVQRLNLELNDLARRDGLTGLPNRRHFDEVLAREWERALRTGHPLCVLLVDVDHFKAYNDHRGHLAGDACLARVAEAMQSAIHRPADLVARYGGEEFVVLLPETRLEGASDLALRLIERVDDLALPHGASQTAAHVTISVGVASQVGRAWPSPADLLAAADEALYEAKHQGRRRHRVHAGERASAA
jgi:diguanylate cyclase (GGDEF)-like protein